MEKNKKLKILECIGTIYEKSKDCRLEDDFFKKIDKEQCFLSSYFHTSKIQSFFISMVFALNYKGDSVDYRDLIEYFDCNPVKLIEYSDDFDFLISHGIFVKNLKPRHLIKVAGTNDQLIINKMVTDAILKNKPIPEIYQEKADDVIGLLEKIYDIVQERDNNEISTIEMFKLVDDILISNLHFPLIKKVEEFKFDIENTYLYLYLIWKTLTGNESVDIGRVLEGIFDTPSNRVNNMQKFLSGENVLIKNNLVEIVDARFFNDTQMKLTDLSYTILNDCGIKLFAIKKKKDNIILPSDIQLRELIFSESEMNQLFLLKDLLGDTKFKETQNRLIDKGLPIGLTVLLHGAPGTGKTEIVKQLAKETNRETMKVEISQSKSKWFGESEKIIKRIFTDYKSYAIECERMPILFFNEADAIISRRKEIGNSNVEQTENAIQNIILEELENFEGILIATTNLANNLDIAFERRFLFKIHFRKPESTIQAKIWKSKLSHLNKMECELLANRFNFSGGQIDNILRKNEINEVLYGNKVSLENLITLCSEESIVSNKIEIGYSKS